MKRLVILLVCFAGLVRADNPENWASLSLICQTEANYRVQVVVSGDVDTVIIVPNATNNLIWQVDSSSKSFEVGLANESLSLTVFAWGGAFNGDSLILSTASTCEIPFFDERFLIETVKTMHRRD